MHFGLTALLAACGCHSIQDRGEDAIQPEQAIASAEEWQDNVEDQPYPVIQRAIGAMFEKGLEPNEIICRAAAVVRNPDGSTRYGGHNVALGRQVIFFLASRVPLDRKTEEGMYVGPNLRLLLNVAKASYHEFWPQDAVIAAAPYLDSPDPNLRSAAQWLLIASDAIEARPHDGVREFERIRKSILRFEPDHRPSDWLLAAMYRVDPDAALNTFHLAPPVLSNREKVPDILIEHPTAIRKYLSADSLRLVAKAKEYEPAALAAIRELSRSELWWVRLYAVAKMAKHESLRDEAVIKSLQNDEDPTVRKAAIKSFQDEEEDGQEDDDE